MRAWYASFLVAIGVALTSAFATSAANADPGMRDLSFGPGVIVKPLIDPGESRTNSVAMDGDRIVVGGFCYDGSNARLFDERFCLARLTSDGRFDLSFGGSGKVITEIGSNINNSVQGRSKIKAIVVQSNRKIVAAGECRDPDGLFAFCIARYQPDGSLDPAFGVGGRVVMRLGGASYRNSLVTSIALQGDGKLIAAGSCEIASTSKAFDFCIARYTDSGALDDTFGVNGVAMTAMTTPKRDSLNALLIQQDGRILVAGECDMRFCVARYSSSGLLDFSFGLNGKKYIIDVPPGTGAMAATSIAQQTDGKLLVAGYCNYQTQWVFCLYRLLSADGVFDPSFGINGRLFAPAGGASLSGYGYSVFALSDQKILMSGRCRDGRAEMFCSMRFTTNGQYDLSYGEQGILRTLRTSANSDLQPVVGVLQQDGKLVQASSCGVLYDVVHVCLARFATDGSLDPSLNGGGSGIARNVRPIKGDAWSLAVQPDGKFLLGGFCDATGGKNFCVARYLSSGVSDPAFVGDNGMRQYSLVSGNDSASIVLLQPDGKIILAGQCQVGATGNNDFCLIRYLPNGAMDASFGAAGQVFTSLGSGFNGLNTGVVQFDGKIAVAGFCVNAQGNYDFCLVRYLPDGSLDARFNLTGKVFTDVAGNTDFALSMVQQFDGKLLVVGTCFTGSQFDFCAVRYRENGELDLSVTISESIGAARGVAQQPDGKIVLVGDCRFGTNPAPSLSRCAIRLREDLTVDTAFGVNGKTGLSDGIAYATAIQPDGKILIGGSCLVDGAKRACIERLNSDGKSVDRTLASSTVGTFDNWRIGSEDEMYAMALLPDGKILQAGTCTYNGAREFCAARYEGGPFNFLSCSLDIDGDGVVTATTDSLIVLRAMRGLSGNAVIAGINFAQHARRTTWGDGSDRDIRRYLREQCSLTIN